MEPADLNSTPSTGEELLASSLERFQADDHARALALLMQARQAFEGDDEHLAVCDQREAMIHSDLGDLGQALRLSTRALAFFEHTGNHTAVAKINTNLGAALIRANEPAEAYRRTWTALRLFRSLHAGGFERATCHENLGIALQALRRLDHASRHFGRAIDLLSGTDERREVIRRGDVLMALASLTAKRGDLARAQQLRLEALQVFTQLDLPYRRGKMERNLAQASLSAGECEEGLKWLGQAEQTFAALGSVWDLAACFRLRSRACLEYSAGSPDQAVAHALEAVRIVEQHRYRIDLPQVRASWIRREQRSYALACRAALANHEPEVVAEVVETARQQATLMDAQRVEPAEDEPDDSAVVQPRLIRGAARLDAEGYVRSAIAIQAGGAPLGPSRSISVRGRSRIAASDDVVRLEALAHRSSGGGWLWGTLVHEESLYWYTRSPSGDIEAGQLDFADSSPARSAATTLASHVRGVSLSNAPRRLVHRGPMGTRRAKPIFKALGGLVPPPLIDALQRHSRNRPMRLAMAHDPILAGVPWPLVPIGDQADAPVLIERASLRHAPPAALLTPLPDDLPTMPISDRIVEVAVLDPRGDLRYARRTIGTRTGRGVLLGRHTSKAHLLDRLACLTPGSPGVAVVAAHVVQSTVDDSLTSEILLSDSSLSAHELLTHRNHIGVPDRLHLAGCTSIGLHNREWLGLASAFLHLGAESVTASLWPLLDDREMLEVDRRIVAALQGALDAADALREAQLSFLDRGRMTTRRWMPRLRRPCPYHWAAYGAIHSAAGNS